MNKQTLENFINRANQIHNNKYDYSEFVYVNWKTKVKIICPYHGIFEQRTDHHLNGNGCNKCAAEQRALKKLISKEEFIKRANEIHNNYYDYSLFTPCKAKDKIKIICPEHGIFEQTYDHHLHQKSKCPKCSQLHGNNLKKDSLETFIKKANKIHKNRYDYSLVNYIGSKIKIKIICPIHGKFEQQPYNHLMKKGCYKCSREQNAFSKSGFTKIAKNKECIFYILKCFNEKEQFYKIGITSRTVQERYKNKKEMPYNYEIIKEYKSTALDIWELENRFKINFKENLYSPEIKFAGSKTECFTSIPDEFALEFDLNN